MNGLLRIVDGGGEREVELPRAYIGIGGGASDSICVEGFSLPPTPVIFLDWSARRGTWVMKCAPAMVVAVSVNGHLAGLAEQFTLNDMDVIELPGVFMQFQRLLAEPVHQKRAAGSVMLGSLPLLIGRADPAATDDPRRLDLDSEETSISREHAEIALEGADYILTDHSRSGMELNGVAFTRERLVFGDRFRIASYIFEFTGSAIHRIHPELSGSICARDLTVLAAGNKILDGVSLNVSAGEFIGVLGGSGQGKSTLLNALCGIKPPTSGTVELGGVPITDRARLRAIGVGFVPQDDIVHRELTVTQAITFSARLRLKLPRHSIDALTARIIARLGLTEHAEKQVGQLSGGQRKRVSIAIELLAKPSILFLDEPSSGLDPATEESLMTLLQSLTLTKLTVVCTTHVLQKAYLFDRIVFVQGGKLVFAGSTGEARQHFMQDAPDASAIFQHSPIERIYTLLADPQIPAAEWERQYRDSPFFHRAFPRIPAGVKLVTEDSSMRRLSVHPLTTLLLLASRQLRILAADPLNLAFIIAQPLLIGFLVSWVADQASLRIFLCIVATMWFGCSNGAQQIVAELPIFRRERVCGQGLNVYLLSKLGFLSAVSLAQAILLFLTALLGAEYFHPENLDHENINQELAGRLIAPGADKAAESTGTDFQAATVDASPASGVAPAAPPGEQEPDEKPAPKPNAFALRALTAVAALFQNSQNLVDSGPRVLLRPDGSPMRDAQGRQLTLRGLSLGHVLTVTIGLKFLAIALAALVGVSIGLAISSLVKNTTQAVLWVPLVLIPQILFGGIVVGVPDMTRSVRAFSGLMPSFAAQRIADVSAIYGLFTPYLTNRTKKPLFLTSRGEKENFEWEADGKTFSQAYDKLSPANSAWQNLVVDPDRLGQHKQVGDRSEDGFQVTFRDTIGERRDVRFTKGTPYRSLSPFHISLTVLTAWVAACYVTILLGLRARQTGK